MQKEAVSIAVIGAGSCGMALAAHLTRINVPVHLWNRAGTGRISALIGAGGIHASGVWEGIYTPTVITDDIQEAISGTTLIVTTVPANAHRDIAAHLAPHLSANQKVVLVPGKVGGAFEVAATLAHLGRHGVTVAEMADSFHTCRAHSNTSIEIFAIKRNILFAALYPQHTRSVIELFPAQLGDSLVPAASTFETGLSDVGMMLHCETMLLNEDRIQRGEKARFYLDYITPFIAEFIEQLDAERLAIAAALSTPIESVVQWLKSTYGVEGETLFDCIQNNPAYESIWAPTSVHHRFLLEDVPTGLVPLEALGEYSGVPTPLITSLIDMAIVLIGRDFRALGRNAKVMNALTGEHGPPLPGDCPDKLFSGKL